MKPLWRIFRRERRPGERIGRLVDVAQIRGDLHAIRRAIRLCDEATAPDTILGFGLDIAHYAYPLRVP